MAVLDPPLSDLFYFKPPSRHPYFMPPSGFSAPLPTIIAVSY